MALVRAFTSWGWRVTYASTSDANNVFASELAASGVAPRQIPANRGPAFEAMLAEASPDIVVFDRFTTEEMFSFRIRELAPSALRVVDTQDLHALRRARAALHDAGASAAAILAACPDASDADTVRELAAIARSDLSLICSPEEHRRLVRYYSVPAQKLALASFFVPAAASAASCAAALPAFGERAHVAWIGNFKHGPNADAAAWLAGPVWDALRPQLPPGTECHLYGAYPTGRATAMTDVKRGVRMLGHAPSIDVLRRYRLLVAPLRYGAGIKGKLLDAWQNGTPVVTTPLGAEGCHVASDAPWRCDYATAADGAPAGDWAGLVDARSDGDGGDDDAGFGGAWRCDDAAGIAAASAALYCDEAAWARAQAAGLRTLRALFAETPALAAVCAALERAHAARDTSRATDFTAGMLWHHTARSTEFFSRFIEVKEGAAAAATAHAAWQAAAQAAQAASPDAAGVK